MFNHPNVPRSGARVKFSLRGIGGFMKVTEHIKNGNGKTQFSFEILPPLKGENIHSIFENIDPLMEFQPPYINVTYHREEYVFSRHQTIEIFMNF